MEVGTKKCGNPECGAFKPLDEFYKRKDTNDGLRKECKNCTNSRGRKYKDKNSRSVKDFQKKYREEHKDERKEYAKQYHKTNAKEIIEKTRVWELNNTDKVEKWESENHDKIKAKIKAWKQANTEKINTNERIRGRRERLFLEDNYIKRLLYEGGISSNLIKSDHYLIEYHRMQLKFKHLIKQKQDESTS